MERISEEVIRAVAEELLSQRQIPSAVYRLQMSYHFPFHKAAELAPYLKKLGIEALYSSPYFAATPESTHGYDVTAPNRLNPELGTDADFDAFCTALSDAGLGHILDFVANHMSATCHNPWWCDVLKKGSDSEYASYFDLSPGKKIALPILDTTLAESIEQGDVTLDGEWVSVGTQKLPLKEGSDLSLPLEKLLAQQHYELTDWRRGGSYRRFFDIAELAAVRQENPEVFSHYHELALDLAMEGKIQGMRIDHPDGLYEPARYFEDLQALYFLEKVIHTLEHRYPDREVDMDACIKVVSAMDVKREKPLYLLAEKILQGDETLPENLSIHGTVGYDFLVRLTGCFVDQAQEEEMTRIYAEYSGVTDPPDEILYQQKKDFLLTYLSGELDQLCEVLPVEKQALIVLLASFPVYRTYISAGKPLSERDKAHLETAFELAELRAPDVDFTTLKEIFFLRSSIRYDEGILRFQQLSAPLMAKGQEDTFFYVYNRLICLNEVGANPINFGTAPDEFHAHNAHRKQFWPYGFIATDTHDTKRSQDVRMRIATLSELPGEWEAFLQQMPKCQDPNFGYFFYQTLLGIYEPDAKDLASRLVDYCQKAIKEAKVHTSWKEPNESYEENIEAFVKRTLQEEKFIDFWKRIDEIGKKKSLSALILSLGSPGVFDLYQGSELWRYCLVDPDNRRPVDFSLREKLLSENTHPKLSLLAKGLNYRKEHKELFLDGEYHPLETTDPSLIAFARMLGKQKIIVAAKRFFTSMSPAKIILPPDFNDVWTDLFTNEPVCDFSVSHYLFLRTAT